MLKIRRCHDRLIFKVGIPHLGKTFFTLRRVPADMLFLRRRTKRMRQISIKLMHRQGFRESNTFDKCVIELYLYLQKFPKMTSDNH